MAIGENLKKARQDKFLTIRELSKKSGVSVSTIVRIENGETTSYPTTIKKLAKTLRISIKSLKEN